MAEPGLLADGRRSSPTWGRHQAKVVAHVGSGDVFRLTLEAPEIAERATAGQFVNLLCTPGEFAGYDPLLRRPFSIAQLWPDSGRILLIYRAIGRGTQLLARVVPGQYLDALGPLGVSFPDPSRRPGTLALVGGGLGIPPLIAAAEYARAAGRAVHAFVGARHAGWLAGAAELAATGVPVTVSTDDGSAGEQGFVTAPLSAALAARELDEIWACGPEVMLRVVQRLAKAAGVTCYLSVERNMACGFGVCIGCTVPRADGKGYFKCCVDGPVFPAGEVDLG